MRDPRVVIGVDGGGTRTRVAVVTESFECLGIGESGSGNFHDVGADVVGEHVAEALARAWHAARREPIAPSAAFLGMASVATEAARGFIRAVAARTGLGPESRVGVDQDLRIALAGGLAGAPGIVLIAGTGSSCYGRTAEGRCWQAGGFGSFLDDGGSAFDLGRRAMIAAVRAYDGRGHPTRLLDDVMNTLRLDDLRELLPLVDADGMSRAAIAALAPLVTRAAENGDAVAAAIIDRGVDEIALAVETVARKLEEATPTVTPSGGLAHSGPAYRERLDRAIRARCPGSMIVDPILPPVLGAALLALESIGAAASPAAIDRLRG